MTDAVEVRPRVEQHQVGLGLAQVAEPQRVPDRHHDTVANRLRKQTVEPVDNPRVRRADGRHLKDLTLEEFQTQIRGEDSGLAHAVVLLDSEEVPRWSHEAGPTTP